jgi:hypothetical protein
MRDAATARAVMRLTQSRRTQQKHGQQGCDGKCRQCASEDDVPIGHGLKVAAASGHDVGAGTARDDVPRVRPPQNID